MRLQQELNERSGGRNEEEKSAKVIDPQHLASQIHSEEALLTMARTTIEPECLANLPTQMACEANTCLACAIHQMAASGWR